MTQMRTRLTRMSCLPCRLSRLFFLDTLPTPSRVLFSSPPLTTVVPFSNATRSLSSSCKSYKYTPAAWTLATNKLVSSACCRTTSSLLADTTGQALATLAGVTTPRGKSKRGSSNRVLGSMSRSATQVANSTKTLEAVACVCLSCRTQSQLPSISYR